MFRLSDSMPAPLQFREGRRVCAALQPAALRGGQKSSRQSKTCALVSKGRAGGFPQTLGRRNEESLNLSSEHIP